MKSDVEPTTARRVLVVDDCRDSARTLRALLRLQGYEAQAATDGEEAIRTAREHRPEVVLLDVTMPGMSGLDVARAMREDPDLAEARIIAVSGYDRERIPEPSPFDDHLVKPIDHERLMGMLKTR